MNPEHSSALTQRASLLIDQNRYKDATDFLINALNENPEDAFALYLLALCQVNIPKQKVLSLETINKAIALDSSNASFFALRSLIYHALDKNKPALDDAELAITIDPESEFAHIARGSALMGMEKWFEAETSFREALKIDPNNQQAGNLLAFSLRHQNRGRETNEQIRNLLAKNPNDSFSHANAGWVALEQHDLEKAKYHFLESLRIDPESENARRGIIETFKAKSPLYRAYLAYCFKMAKLSRRARIGLIIGLYLAVKFIKSSFTGSLAIIGTIAVFLYMFFVMWSWVARGVGNMFLFLNDFARNALIKSEKIEAILVGGNVLAGIVISIAGFGLRIHQLLFLGPALIGAAFPFTLVFNNDNRIGKYVYAGVGIVVMSLGLYSTVSETIPFFDIPPGYGAIIISVAVTWVGSFGFLRK